ncbi:MAG: DNA-binding protein WhiA [Oscillospiraceae bacterium]
MAQSFSKKAKTEALDNFKFSKNDCCNISFLSGYFAWANLNSQSKEIISQADIQKSAKAVKKLLSRYEIDAYVVEKEKVEGKTVTRLYITEEESVQRLYTLQVENVLCDKCLEHFFTGIFVSDGILVNPEKEYHLEFGYKDNNVALSVADKLSQGGFDFKVIKRKNKYVVYTKNSETIEDFLVTVGAQSTCLEIMSGKVIKDIRNRMNRITNCDVANIAKSARAGQKYLQSIEFLVSEGKFDLLSDDLKQIAQLKLDNPELSFTELGQECKPPMTKSSVNRRMQKLCQLAQIKE